MEICCINSTLWGADIDVRGTIYTISRTGRVDVPDAHAEILLQSSAWRLVDTLVAERTNVWTRALCRSLPLRDLIDVARMSGISITQAQDEIFAEIVTVLKEESVPDTFKRLEQYKKNKEANKEPPAAAVSAPAPAPAPASAPAPAPAPAPAASSK